MLRELTRAGSRPPRPWRGVLFCCLALLLALDDSASCWRLALDGARGRGETPAAPDNAEEALVKHAHHPAGAQRRGARPSGPPGFGGPVLVSHSSPLARPSSSPPVRIPSAVHALVSPLRC